jgi:hypothetical protein
VAAAGAPDPGAAAASVAARQRLAAMRDLLDPATATEETARRLIPQLRTLLGALATPDDSATALLRLGEAYVLADEQGAACAAWKRALGAARDPRTISALSNNRQGVGCPP